MTKDDTGSRSAILLISCPDLRGLVAAVTEFIHANNGNILFLEQHVDSSDRFFFMRAAKRNKGRFRFGAE